MNNYEQKILSYLTDLCVDCETRLAMVSISLEAASDAVTRDNDRSINNIIVCSRGACRLIDEMRTRLDAVISEVEGMKHREIADPDVLEVRRMLAAEIESYDVERSR